MATATQTSKSNNKSSYADRADIEEQLAKLSEDVKALTSIVADYSSGKVDSAKASATERAGELRERSVRQFETASKQALALENDFEDQIRANPLAAIGIAAGIGFLMAKLTKK